MLCSDDQAGLHRLVSGLNTGGSMVPFSFIVNGMNSANPVTPFVVCMHTSTLIIGQGRQVTFIN